MRVHADADPFLGLVPDHEHAVHDDVDSEDDADKEAELKDELLQLLMWMTVSGISLCA